MQLFRLWGLLLLAQTWLNIRGGHIKFTEHRGRKNTELVFVDVLLTAERVQTRRESPYTNSHRWALRRHLEIVILRLSGLVTFYVTQRCSSRRWGEITNAWVTEKVALRCRLKAQHMSRRPHTSKYLAPWVQILPQI